MRSTHFLRAVDLQLSVLIVGSWATSAGSAETKKKPPRKRAIVVVRKTVSRTLDQTIILVIKRRAKQNPSQCREKSKLAGGGRCTLRAK